MRACLFLTAVSLLAIAMPVAAQSAPAQTPANPPAQDAAPLTDPGTVTEPQTAADLGDIVVTARRREETLQDVPVAITAVSGDTIEQRGLTSVRDVAQSVPGLSINSDGAGRAFVAIRGVGVTLVQSVQPGVGLFVDGIYRPNTAYLNNPLLDVERIEVLRGPQGTLYGKNTLGGAINVITRQPGNETQVRGLASYAGPDDQWIVSGSLSTPIVTDTLAVRIAGSHREQDGFLRNIVVGGRQNYLNTDSINGTLRFTPGDALTFSVNAYFDSVFGANTPYARVTGPRDYRRTIEFNNLNQTDYEYFGVNGRLEVPLGGIDTNLTLMAAYDGRNSEAVDSDADFGPTDIVRSTTTDELDTYTAELRLDSEWSDRISTLFGLFYSRENTEALQQVRIVPLNITRNVPAFTKADTYAVFGTVFYRPSDQIEAAFGLRYDHEDRVASGNVGLKSNEVQPKVSLTYKATPNWTTYASVARGYRGGGFNAPTAPLRVYRGDSAWTYELGTRYSDPGRVFSLSGATFHSDYSDYIGLNSIAPSSAGGLVTVDLNSGDVESYGLELEGTLRPMRNWTLSGSFTYIHARLTDSSAYTAITGRLLSSDRLTFQPDTTFSINSDYVVPLGDDSLTLTVGATGKGKRLAATLNQITPTFLDSYVLVNAQATYRTGPFEITAFVNNAFQEDFFESYIERTTLVLAGLPASDLGIVGDRRRYGARLRFEF